MKMKQDNDTSLSNVIGRAADALLDGILGIVVKTKEKRYDQLTFDEVRRLACGLKHECSGYVKGYKCYIVFDKDNVCYKVGIFPVDADMNTFGGKDVVMDVVRAESLDGKLVSLMKDSTGGKFFITVE